MEDSDFQIEIKIFNKLSKVTRHKSGVLDNVDRPLFLYINNNFCLECGKRGFYSFSNIVSKNLREIIDRSIPFQYSLFEKYPEHLKIVTKYHPEQVKAYQEYKFKKAKENAEESRIKKFFRNLFKRERKLEI